MDIDDAGGGGGQLALKDAVKHGDPYEYPYEYVYEGTREMYAPLFNTAGNKLRYVLHMDTRGVYTLGEHYQGQTDDGSWHEPIAELSGTGTEGTLFDPSDDDAHTLYGDFGDEPIPRMKSSRATSSLTITPLRALSLRALSLRALRLRAL